MISRNLLHLALATVALAVGCAPLHADGPTLLLSPATGGPNSAPTPTPSSDAAPASAATPTGPTASPDSVIPTAPFPASRYEALWTKSPFAVATSEDTVQASPDYMLVGVGNQDGTFYASLIERDNQEHFLISSDKTTRGLIVKSINRSRDGQETYASVIKDGQPLSSRPFFNRIHRPPINLPIRPPQQIDVPPQAAPPPPPPTR
jgi:hypothetical protein